MCVAQAAESVDLAPAMHIVEEMSPVTSGDIIPLLQRLQEAYGYLPRTWSCRSVRRLASPRVGCSEWPPSTPNSL